MSKLFKRLTLHYTKASSDRYVKHLRKLGVTIGEDTYFYGNVNIDTTRPLLVELGSKCSFSDGVTILTHDFGWSVLKEKYGSVLPSSGKVKIGNNVWLGHNVTVLRGVCIGDNVIIGAGAVVTHDIQSDSVAVGVPAKVIMSLEEYYHKRKNQWIKEAIGYARRLYEVKGEVSINDFREEHKSILDVYGHWYNFLEDAGVSH